LPIWLPVEISPKAQEGRSAFLVIAHTAAIATFKPAALLTLLTVPLTLSLARAIMSGVSGKALIPLLGKTGKLQLSFSIIFALALAI